ncbi:MAG: hypothetical protein ACXABG_12765 [Promethearchaeota archaeon]
MPVNVFPALHRLTELFKEARGVSEEAKKSWEIRAIVWWLNTQMFGQLSTIDLIDEYSEIMKLKEA